MSKIKLCLTPFQNDQIIKLGDKIGNRNYFDVLNNVFQIGIDSFNEIVDTIEVDSVEIDNSVALFNHLGFESEPETEIPITSVVVDVIEPNPIESKVKIKPQLKKKNKVRIKPKLK
jgi:hypothetical protein